MSIEKEVLKAIEERDPKAFGRLTIHQAGSTFFVTGELYSELSQDELSTLVQDEISKMSDNALVYFNPRTPASRLSVTHTGAGDSVSEWASDGTETILDEVATLYQGAMDLKAITPNLEHKIVNFETLEKVKNIVTVTGVMAPLILDKNLKIIDGGLRYEVARLLEREEVPVMVVDAEGRKADFLRLVLNRSSEFQRWIYADVDEVVDALPQVQPLLEPLGFFSNTILPVTFFGNTVIEYTLDEYNDQMKKYSQDIGLAEWAKMRREEELAKEEARKERLAAKPATEGMVSLFNLTPTEDDFVETYDPHQVIEDHVAHMKDVAGGITENYDKKMKAIKEEKGQKWQNSRRTSKKLAADKRAAAELEEDDLLNSATEGTEEE